MLPYVPCIGLCVKVSQVCGTHRFAVFFWMWPETSPETIPLTGRVRSVPWQMLVMTMINYDYVWYLGGFINQPMGLLFFWRNHGWWWLILGFYQPLRDALWKNHWRFWELMGTASKLSQVPKVRLLWKWALRLGSAARRSCLGQSGSWVLVLVYFDEKHSNKYVNV